MVKADILKRLNGAWEVFEVKSGFSDTDKMNEYVDDLAYTVMVLRRAGLQIAKSILVLLSRDYRFGEGPEHLFKFVDKTEDVNTQATEFVKVANNIAHSFFSDTQQVPTLVSACRDCDFFSHNCLGSGLAHTVLEIPRLHSAKLRRLSQAGIIEISKIPDDLSLNDLQNRAKSAAVSEKMIVEIGLSAALAPIEWPCQYLDFETVATVLPLYKGHGCHRQVVTQFSIHHRGSIGAACSHSEYLSDAGKDCERELAEALIEKLGDRGSILVYGSFEGTRIRRLRDAFPDLEERLTAIISRLKNLLQIIENNVYHPDFRGSFSIKKVLPVLVPDLSYEGFAVADGDTAITRFARMARGEIKGPAVEATREALLQYCKIDTLAMVRLHEKLDRMSR